MKKQNTQKKGEHSYDYKHDILLFKIKGQEYERSIEFEDIVVDFDLNGLVMGIQIFDASKLFNISKIYLKSIEHFEFVAKTETDLISIQLKFIITQRNKQIIQQGQNFIRESTTPLKESIVKCVT